MKLWRHLMFRSPFCWQSLTFIPQNELLSWKTLTATNQQVFRDNSEQKELLGLFVFKHGFIRPSAKESQETLKSDYSLFRTFWVQFIKLMMKMNLMFEDHTEFKAFPEQHGCFWLNGGKLIIFWNVRRLYGSIVIFYT